MNAHKNTALALVTGILFGGHLFLLAPLTIYFANHNEFSIELSQILLYLLTASAVSSVFIFALILVLHKKSYVRLVAFDLPPRTSPPSMLDPGPFEVHSKG